MFDCAAVATTIEDLADPRISDRTLRCVPATTERGTVLLVGVVHDHPASTARVRRLLERIAPDVLALELPALAVPLFRRYARNEATPPRLGGEMSAAIQAVGETRTVGIDAPNRRYLRVVGRQLRATSGDWSVAVAVLRDTVVGTAQAFACLLGWLAGHLLRRQLRVYSAIDHDCSIDDPVDRQAAHEARHLSRQRTFLRAVEMPPARAVIDSAREETMATRLHDLRAAGDVIAVMGVEHLDAVDSRLRALAAP